MATPSRTTRLTRLYIRLVAGLNKLCERIVFGLNRSAVFVCVSDGVAEEMRSHFPRARERVMTIHNGVDLEAFSAGSRRPRPRRCARSSRSPPGDWWRRSSAASGSARGRARHPRARRRARVGPAGRRRRRQERYEELARSLDVAESVHWLGVTRDVPLVLEASDALVFPSTYEAFPLVALKGPPPGWRPSRPPSTGPRADHRRSQWPFDRPSSSHDRRGPAPVAADSALRGEMARPPAARPRDSAGAVCCITTSSTNDSPPSGAGALVGAGQHHSSGRVPLDRRTAAQPPPWSVPATLACPGPVAARHLGGELSASPSLNTSPPPSARSARGSRPSSAPTTGTPHRSASIVARPNCSFQVGVVCEGSTRTSSGRRPVSSPGGRGHPARAPVRPSAPRPGALPGARRCPAAPAGQCLEHRPAASRSPSPLLGAEAPGVADGEGRGGPSGTRSARAPLAARGRPRRGHPTRVPARRALRASRDKSSPAQDDHGQDPHAPGGGSMFSSAWTPNRISMRQRAKPHCEAASAWGSASRKASSVPSLRTAPATRRSRWR